MKASDIPTRIAVPWANSAGAGFVRNVPVASQIGITDGAASYETGFPPLNFSPVASGGVPPFGQDMNGALRLMTQWLRWAAGGSPLIYNSAYQAAVGGYAQGATIFSANLATPLRIWQSLVDDNTTDPETDPSWEDVSPDRAAGGILSGNYPNPDVDVTELLTQLGMGTYHRGNPGWYTLPGGLLVQYGQQLQTLMNPDGTPIAVAFGTPFGVDAGQPISVRASGLVPTSGVGGNDVWGNVAQDSVTTTGFSAVFNGSGATGLNQIRGVNWSATGPAP